MRLRLVHVLLLAACVRPSVDPPRAPPAETLPRQRPPRFGCDASGPKLRATEQGIEYHDPLDPMAEWTRRPGRLLRLDGYMLYFFAPDRPILQTPEPGSTYRVRTVVELPPIAHPGFSASDPLGYLWRQEDLSVTDHVLCMDLHDRPDDPRVTYNIRIDLGAATLERRLVLDRIGQSDGSGHEAVLPRLCTPAGPSAAASEDGNCVYVGWHSVIPLDGPRRPRAGGSGGQ